MPVNYVSKYPWAILFRIEGSVWLAVIPYCLLNCGITFLAYRWIKNHKRITFSAQGHALMSLIISYLVVSKVYLSLERYMSARKYACQAMISLRELYQLVLTYTEDQQAVPLVKKWQVEAREKIENIVQSMIRMVKDEEVVKDQETTVYMEPNEARTGVQNDPLVDVQLLRSHLYSGCAMFPGELHLLERVKLVDKLESFCHAYKELFMIASTPLPFPMIQMGRTFLFLWTFSMPFALIGVIDEIISTMIFVFFLTYGFIGLEFVSMQLLRPFGDGKNDIDIVGLGKATSAGMIADEVCFRSSSIASLQHNRSSDSLHSRRFTRLMYKRQKSEQSVSVEAADPQSNYASGYYVVHDG